MNQLHKHKEIVLFSAAIFLISSCQNYSNKNEGLGIVDIQVSGSQEAIPYFKIGLLLLHSFEYKDARDAFLQAQEIDPLMAMAYWGEAMTYNHPLWREQDYNRGAAALNRLNVINEQIQISSLENDLIQSVKILYSDNPDKANRDGAYMTYLASLCKKYPENLEVSAFYALALLGSVPIGRDIQTYIKAAEVAKQVLDQNSDHPGALHYLIHAYDDPVHAHLAKEAADSYAKIAPKAGHALHMPSHIYVSLGDWDNVVASNIDSYQASLNRKERKQLSNDARGYHAYHWLEYGYLQQKKKAKARKMVLDMQEYASQTPSKRGRVHLLFLKGTYLVETNDWNDEEVASIVVDVSDLNVANRCQNGFIQGMIAYQNENLAQLDKIISNMESDYEVEALTLSDSNITICTDLSPEATMQSDIDQSEVMTLQLMALRSQLVKDELATEKYLQLSIEKEEALSFIFGPPFIQKPTHEQYADWLLEQNRYREAKYHYEQSLKKTPNRTWALNGIDESKKNDQSLTSLNQIKPMISCWFESNTFLIR